MLQIIDNLSKQPTVCIILSVIIFLFSFLTNYLLLDSLLEMHRSKSAVKKLKKEYTFLQRITEQLKAQDQMAWVQRMNNVRNRAEEIVNAEVIFA